MPSPAADRRRAGVRHLGGGGRRGAGGAPSGRTDRRVLPTRGRDVRRDRGVNRIAESLHDRVDGLFIHDVLDAALKHDLLLLPIDHVRCHATRPLRRFRMRALFGRSESTFENPVQTTVTVANNNDGP